MDQMFSGSVSFLLVGLLAAALTGTAWHEAAKSRGFFRFFAFLSYAAASLAVSRSLWPAMLAAYDATQEASAGHVSAVAAAAEILHGFDGMLTVVAGAGFVLAAVLAVAAASVRRSVRERAATVPCDEWDHGCPGSFYWYVGGDIGETSSSSWLDGPSDSSSSSSSGGSDGKGEIVAIIVAACALVGGFVAAYLVVRTVSKRLRASTATDLRRLRSRAPRTATVTAEV